MRMLLKRSCENAILVSSLLDWVSVIGRVLSERLRTTGCKVMYLILIHLLERLADPCSLVQSSAQTTINMVMITYLVLYLYPKTHSLVMCICWCWFIGWIDRWVWGLCGRWSLHSIEQFGCSSNGSLSIIRAF